MRLTYKEEHSLEKRLSETNALREKYPDRIGLIIEPTPSCTLSTLSGVQKRKYAVYNDMHCSAFMNIVRQKLELAPEIALIFFVNGKHLITGSQLISEIYDQYKNEDGFLYIEYCVENAFG